MNLQPSALKADALQLSYINQPRCARSVVP